MPSYNVLNLMVSVDPADKDWGFDVMVYNATDEDGVNSRMTDVFGVSATGVELIPPRQIMGRIMYSL